MISIYHSNTYPFKYLKFQHSRWLFPGGEIGVRLFCCPALKDGPTKIVARLKNSDDIMELVMAADAVKRAGGTFSLVLPYVPYGRQDRVCCEGESLSVKAFATIVNGLGATSVTVLDPHSDVTPAVIDRCKIVDSKTIIGQFDELNAYLQPGRPDDRPVFVSPDAGANKKVADLAGFYGRNYFIRADKLRDLATGKIKEIVVINPREEVEDRNCIIIDDLCDAGGTFVGLAAALKAKGAKSVVLYVTHGLFTKGTDVLYKGGIDEIYTTNSYHDIWPAGISDKVKTWKLEEYFKLNN